MNCVDPRLIWPSRAAGKRRESPFRRRHESKRIGQHATRNRRSTICRFSSTIEARLSPTTYRQPRKLLDLMRPGTKQLLAFALISATLIGVKFGIYTRSHVVNVLLLFSCLAAYTFIALCAFALKPPLLGAALGTLLSLPIAASILASPLILLAGIWALNDFAAGPDAAIPMANGLLCVEYSSGTAVTEATQTFELNRPVLGLFWVRLAIESGPILEGYPFQEGCASVYEKWRSSVKSSM